MSGETSIPENATTAQVDPPSNRGGARPGSGRKPGAQTKKSAVGDARVQEILGEGKSPLHILIAHMRDADAEAAKLDAEVAAMRAKIGDNPTPEDLKALTDVVRVAAGLKSLSRECAKDAAPYVHPKRNPIDRAVNLSMPAIKTVADVSVAQDAVTEALAAGDITLEESVKLFNVLEQRRKAFETIELEKRIAALEQTKKD